MSENIQNNVEYEKVLNIENKIIELQNALIDYGASRTKLHTELDILYDELFKNRERYDKQRLKEYSSKN
jgi:hypothetical protein